MKTLQEKKIKKLEEALKVAMKSLGTYGSHPLIVKQANNALGFDIDKEIEQSDRPKTKKSDYLPPPPPKSTKADSDKRKVAEKILEKYLITPESERSVVTCYQVIHFDDAVKALLEFSQQREGGQDSGQVGGQDEAGEGETAEQRKIEKLEELIGWLVKYCKPESIRYNNYLKELAALDKEIEEENYSNGDIFKQF